MSRSILSASLVLLLSAFAFADGPTTAPTTRPVRKRATSRPTTQEAIKPNAAIPEDLAKAMQSARQLAIDGKFVELMELVAPPEAVARMQANGQMDRMVAKFNQEAGMFIDTITAALEQEPEISDNGNTAVFSNAGPRPLRFTLRDGKWTLK